MRFPPILAVAFFLLALSARAQRTSLTLSYGNYLFEKGFPRTDGQQMSAVNTKDAFTIGHPIQSVGLFANGMFRIDQRWKISGHFGGAKFLPQQFTVNDSVSGKISGCLYTVSAGYDLFPKIKAIDLIFSGGLNLGRTKLVQEKFDFLEKSGNNLHVKNMFISPKASCMLQVFVGKFVLNLNAEYAYDISGSNWKEKLLARHKPESVDVPDFSQTGLAFSVGLGWNVPMGSKSNYSNVIE